MRGVRIKILVILLTSSIVGVSSLGVHGQPRSMHGQVGALLPPIATAVPPLNVAVPISSAQWTVCMALPASPCVSNKPSTLPLEVFAEVEVALREILPQLVKSDDHFAQKLGFTSASEVAGATIAPPFSVYLAGLETMRHYQSSSNPSSTIELLRNKINLINDTPIRLVFPVLVSGLVRSSVLVTQENQSWSVSALGLSVLAKQFITAQKDKSDFALWVPWLNRYYLGEFVNDKNTDHPFRFTQIIGLNLGPPFVPIPAFALFNQLKAEAQGVETDQYR